jgi:hypothetical protein
MAFTRILSIFFAMSSVVSQVWANDLPLFAAKQTIENIRFMTFDGRFTYSQKRSGALTLSTSFRSEDVLENAPGTNYHITSSMHRKNMVVEVEANWHQELDLTKNHGIYVGSYGGRKFNKIGAGRVPRLHLNDEWLTWFDPKEKAIHVQFLAVPTRHQIIKLGRKHNPYFMPEIVMLNPETVLYTDINDKGFAALLSWNLIDKRMTVVQKSNVSGTRLELCRHGDMIVLGEFSYDDANRGTSIYYKASRAGAPSTLGGFNNVYRAAENDLGQMICAQDSVWFIKTMSEDKVFNLRQTEAAHMELPSGKITTKSQLYHVTNIIDMDGRIILPFRDQFFILQGSAGSTSDSLQAPPLRKSP